VNIRHRGTRTLLAALAVILPGAARRFVHCRLLGYEIARTARVGHSLIDVDRLRMDEGAQIGSLTIIRGCEDVELGPEAAIGPLNFINAVRRDSHYFAGRKRHPAVIMGRAALISSMHFIDACDAVTLADYAAIAGFGTQVLTHSVDVVRLRQMTKPVTVGHHALIATASVLLPGSDVPACSIVSAGSVVSSLSTPEGHRLYSGVPAELRRELDPGMKLFHRTESDVL
jgi:acetyltransferase-like isoleucine patch superfamily enzyme